MLTIFCSSRSSTNTSAVPVFGMLLQLLISLVLLLNVSISNCVERKISHSLVMIVSPASLEMDGSTFPSTTKRAVNSWSALWLLYLSLLSQFFLPLFSTYMQYFSLSFPSYVPRIVLYNCYIYLSHHTLLQVDYSYKACQYSNISGTINLG